jgi:hypothetical protein
MNRRAFVTGRGALAAPIAGRAQPATKVSRIAVIASGAPPPTPPGHGPFYERLSEHGRDFVVERRAFGDRVDRIPDFTTELIPMCADVFVVEGGTEVQARVYLEAQARIVSFPNADRDALLARGRRVLGAETTLTVEFVDTIPRTAAGKFVRSIGLQVVAAPEVIDASA